MDRGARQNLSDYFTKGDDLSTRIIAGWHMAEDSNNSQPPNQAVSDFTQTQHCGAYSLQAK